MFGPDLSNNQGVPDYAKLIAAKPAFVIAKCSQGTSFTDRVFGRTRDHCGRAGIPFGAYHFSNNTDPVKEAAFFCDLVGKLGQGELRPTLDLETGHPNNAWARAFQAQVKKRLGVTPLLYTYPSYYDALGGWKREDTWIADLCPPGQSKIPNVLHQFSWHSRIAGVADDVDMNYTADLRALLAFPSPVLTPNEQWFLWARWRLGEGEFKSSLPHDARAEWLRTHRPEGLPRRIPPSWWVRLARFLANRKLHRARGPVSVMR